MKPTSRQLASRDPALAATMGALPGPNFGRDVRSRRSNPNTQFGFGFGFGDDYGQDAAPAAGGHHGVHPAALHAAHAKLSKQSAHTDNRLLLLDPNKHSTVKVEGYSFSLLTNLVLNTASAINTTLQPNAMLRPKRIVTNAPSPAFVTLASLLIANVNVLVGANDDAFLYSANSFGSLNDLPTLDMSTRATVTGNYTGFVPPGFANGFTFPFIVTLQGPSVLAGNGPSQ